MSVSAPLNALFYVCTVRLLIKAFPLLFPVPFIIIESLLLYPSVELFPELSMSVDPYLLVSAAPKAFASGVDPLPFVIVTDHPISDSERTIPGLFLLFGVRIINFGD